MCYALGDDVLITVEEKTDKVKYEFLRAYYTLWNSIVHPENRVIVDCHAGSGHVYFKQRNGKIKKIYGSPLQAILRTIAKSQKLTIILNEIAEPRFIFLKDLIQEIQSSGIRIFQRDQPKYTAYKSITDQEHKVKVQNLPPEKRYPDEIDAQPPRGFVEKKIKTKSEIILRNGDASGLLDEVFSKYLLSGTRTNKEGVVVPWRTKAIFLIDPCGHISWHPLLERICERANREEGIEIILNWNYSAIARNLSTPNRTSILSSIYSIPEEEVDKEFPSTMNMEDFLEKYKEKLRQYFLFVNEVGVPRTRKIQPKMSSYREYFLIFCSNNESAGSLSLNKAKELSRNIVEHEDILKWVKPR